MTTAVCTVYDQVRHWAVRAGDRTAVSVRHNGVATDLSYSMLLDLVALCAAAIRDAGVTPGDRVLLALPNDESFVAALLGCVAAGGVAVPAPVPTGRRPDAFQARIRGIVADCSPSLVFTLAEWTAELTALLPAGSRQTVLAWESVRCPTALPPHEPACGAVDRAEPPCRAVAPAQPAGAANEVCLLQYTSGSTGRPKGVVVTHRMLAAHCAQAQAVYGERVDDIAVSWVPLFHDMGLITGLIRPLYSGYRTVLLRPDEFVAAPHTWLEAVHASRGTLSSAPNFAYDLCVRRIEATRVAELDLSGWRVARNAGEAVRPDTADRFVRHFAAAGFRAGSFCPSYGLAEATLTVTACTPATPAIRAVVRQADLDRGFVTPRVLAGNDPGETAGSRSERLLLSSGVPLPDTRVRVGNGRPGEVGDIVVTGPQVSDGYWPRAPGSSVPRTVVTGDIGFCHDGHLFVLGRRDDTLIVNGRNYFLSDIAAACAGIEGIRPGRVAAFLARGPGHDEEVVWLVAEISSAAQVTAQRRRRLQRQIQRQVLDRTELFLAQVALLRPGGMPVTTSGKVRVSQVRRQVEDGSLISIAEEVADEPSS